MNAVVEALMPVSNMIIFRVRDRREIVAHHERMLAALRDRDGSRGGSPRRARPLHPLHHSLTDATDRGAPWMDAAMRLFLAKAGINPD
ncbi:hypothetical protein K9U40_03915 [Xanthobacter autotrophicus]|uniref:hypothetical protein n=1 Tax=Xanthobacter autotrophicus TaxID=280 RepID=UPI0024AA5B20|nr:hypothetical protein [Xanthobacter autotrophicus]MDI4663485.1 hypothetical protein [Xanthobacter autotrophicus]